MIGAGDRKDSPQWLPIAFHAIFRACPCPSHRITMNHLLGMRHAKESTRLCRYAKLQRKCMMAPMLWRTGLCFHLRTGPASTSRESLVTNPRQAAHFILHVLGEDFLPGQILCLSVMKKCSFLWSLLVFAAFGMMTRGSPALNWVLGGASAFGLARVPALAGRCWKGLRRHVAGRGLRLR